MSTVPRRSSVIVDTNVIVAGLLTANDTSPVIRILDGMLAAAFPFVLSEPLLAEYRTVLVRPRLRKLHGLTVAEVEVILTDLAQHAIVLSPSSSAAPPAPDPGSLSNLSDRNEPSGKARTDLPGFEAHSGSMQRETGQIWTASPTGAVDQPQVRQAARDQLLWDLLATRADLLLVTGDKRLLQDPGMRNRVIAPHVFVADMDLGG